MGRHHAEHVHAVEGLELRAICDVLPERRDAAREEQPGAAICESLEELLERQDVELVVLITPHDTHAPLSIQASRAGKHVLTEKVMCLNVSEADEMIAATRNARRMLSVYQNRRWDGDYLLVRSVLASGILGKLVQIESSVNGYWFPVGWRGSRAHGGGMLYDWGAHLADQIVQMMLPAMPRTVFATQRYGGHEGVDVETQSTVSITFDNGVVAQFDVGCVSHLSRPRWLIRGEDAALRMEGWDTALIRGRILGTLAGDFTLKAPESRWRAVYENVRDHLLEGAELAVKPEDVRLSVAVLDAARQSAETEQAVRVSLPHRPEGE